MKNVCIMSVSFFSTVGDACVFRALPPPSCIQSNNFVRSDKNKKNSAKFPRLSSWCVTISSYYIHSLILGRSLQAAVKYYKVFAWCLKSRVVIRHRIFLSLCFCTLKRRSFFSVVTLVLFKKTKRCSTLPRYCFFSSFKILKSHPSDQIGKDALMVKSFCTTVLNNSKQLITYYIKFTDGLQRDILRLYARALSNEWDFNKPCSMQTFLREGGE